MGPQLSGCWSNCSMATPALRSSRFRPLFLGLVATACGTALCLASSACGGKGEGASPTPADQNTAGTDTSSGAKGNGGSAPSSGGTTNPVGGVSSGGAAPVGGSIASGGMATGGNASGGAAAGGFAAGGSPVGPLGGTALRPELGADAADDFTPLKYLEKAGNVAAPVA